VSACTTTVALPVAVVAPGTGPAPTCSMDTLVAFSVLHASVTLAPGAVTWPGVTLKDSTRGAGGGAGGWEVLPHAASSSAAKRLEARTEEVVMAVIRQGARR
jgi:hypothetical protein